jgi:hypothetical protein
MFERLFAVGGGANSDTRGRVCSPIIPENSGSPLRSFTANSADLHRENIAVSSSFLSPLSLALIRNLFTHSD